MKKITLLSIASIISIIITAQTGPGGVGSSTNNVIWLDPAQLTYGTVPNISAWPDQSGNGNDFSQGTASLQPYRIGYTGFNAVRFRNDYIQNNGIAALNSTTVTEFFVFEDVQPNHIGVVFDASYTQSTQFLRTYRNNGNHRTWALSSTGGIKDNTTAVSGAFQILSSVWDGAGAQTFTSYKNGTSIGSKAGANGNPTGNYKNTIGAAINGGNKFSGDMGDIIIYNTVLNSAQLNIVNNYLSSKYSIAIANDRFTYESTHKYDLIGIGQEADGNNLSAKGKGIVTLTSPSLDNGDYVFIGHNNTALSLTSVDVPGTISGGSRISRTWRAGVTATPGNVDIDVDITSLPLPTGSYYLLVESNNGIFNDGDVVEYGPFADVEGVVSFTGVALTDGDYITLASGSSAGISSIKSGYWDQTSTWNCGCIPTATDNVTIETGHTVTSRFSSYMNDLTINGTLNTSPTTFEMKGDYTVAATGAATHVAVTFNGTSTQSIVNNSASTIDFYTLIINNASNVELNGGNFQVSNRITVSAGQLQNISSTFTLTSTSTRTAVILDGTTGNGFSGNFIVQRFLSQRNANWGDLSSPVTNNHLSDWDSDPSHTSPELFMCGVNGISGNCGGWESVWYYDAPTQNLIAITDTSYVLSTGKGIEIWLADDQTTLYDKTFDSRGSLNYGTIPVAVSNGSNLVGNPYQSWVDWTKLTKPTLSGTYNIWNTNNGSFDTKTSGYIPPSQSFWVESTGSGTLTFKENSKVNSASSTFWKTASQPEEAQEPYFFVESMLKVKNTKHNYSHELKLRLNDLATIELDEFDGSFLPSRIIEAPSITAYNNKNSKHLAITSFNQELNVVIPIAINFGDATKLTLEAINFENMYDLYKKIELVDTKTNSIYNLKSVKEIELVVDKEITEPRYELRLSNSTTLLSVDNSTIQIYKTNEFTIIEFNSSDELNYNVSIINVLGQKLIDDYINVNTNKLYIPNNTLPKGINIISVKTKGNVLVKKLNY